MKRSLRKLAAGAAASIALSMLALTTQAQVTNFIVNEFDSSNEVVGVWGNWFGGALQSATWDGTTDVSNNPSSGSLLINALFTGTGQQFMLWDGANGITPAIDGTTVTNFQCDIKFDATSGTNGNGNYGTLFFGSRGTDFGQHQFGGYFSVPAGNNGWFHVSLPVNANVQPLFATIPDVLCQIQTYGGAASVPNGTVKFWIDNIKFVGPLAAPSNPPPTLAVHKATPGMRVFAGSTGSIYDREMLASVDQNQSWIGGTYPVSYSFTILSYPNDVNIGQTHIFLVPINTSPVGAYGYNGVDFLATNELWMVINPQGNGTVNASVAWKTNAENSNPNNVALTINNPTAVGTWTLTFNSASTGTLTAPGAAPAAFTITDPNVATDFANPVCVYFGLQPNGAVGEGEYEDWKSIRVTGVAGVNEFQDYTQTNSIDLGQWVNMAALPASLVVVTTNDPIWVTWTTPDTGFESGLGTKADLADTVTPWHTPGFWNSVTPTTTKMGPVVKWTLIPNECLPTSNGNPGGPISSKGFFRLSNPPPAL